MKTAILGASGYAGGELVRFVDDHDGFHLVHLGAHTQSGMPLGSVHPHLAGGNRVLGSNDPDDLPEVDLVFLALPHGASAEIGKVLADGGTRVVDLGADYRLDTDDRYLAAYGASHPHPEDLTKWVYGLPELFDCTDTGRVASPGCYPTTTIVGLAPLVTGGLIDPSTIVVNAVSGVSGAGRKLADQFLFGSIDEGVVAYGVGRHRHRPEMEMALEMLSGKPASVTFTPHLVPMQRGIVATSTASLLDPGTSRSELLDTLRSAYDGRPFVEVLDEAPQSRWTVNSNRAMVSAFVDAPTGRVVVTAALDNLVKGAAGQAVQAANLMVDLPEDTGLPMHGWMP
ncbi:MAG: N-acetyl-gamma-glutamyl-phosphate reductase [Acidimicrobiia bacterium]|nr:N-acetyl-gamma-glutamyl-phosphate reductase [Acidimicrobiia bacterium]